MWLEPERDNKPHLPRSLDQTPGKHTTPTSGTNVGFVVEPLSLSEAKHPNYPKFTSKRSSVSGYDSISLTRARFIELPWDWGARRF